MHADSGFPIGESLERADSFLLLFLSWLLNGFFEPVILVKLMTVIGPVLNAMAAEGMARDGFGVRRPWSLMAGVVYGFSGISAVAVLEGHPWYLLQPWLPGIVWAWVRSADSDAPWRWGLVAGVCWVGCLLTSAYFGIFGLVLLGALAIAEPRRTVLMAGGLVGVSLPVGIAYSWMFLEGGRWSQPTATGTEMLLRMGSTTLAGLATWSEASDLSDHSLCAPVGWAGFFCLLFAPVILRREREWRIFFGLALFSLVAMLGRSIRWDTGIPWMDWPIERLLGVPGLSFFRFPIRFGWLYALSTGLVAAQVLEALARALPRNRVLVVLGLAFLDAGPGLALSWRLREVVAAMPDAYQKAPSGRAILDLFGRSVHHSGELEMWAQNLACYYQAFHQRPILDVCLGTMITSPRHVVDHWLTRSVMTEPMEGVGRQLGELGIGTVALHADWYRPVDLLALQKGLRTSLGEPVAESYDGGEHLLVWVVEEVVGADPVAAWERIRAQVE